MASYGLYTSPPITYHLCKPYPWSYGLIRVRRRSKNDWKWARISLYLIKKRVFMREMLHLQALEYLWECQNCICDVLLSSKLVLDLNLEQKLDLGPTGNWTPVSRVTGGDTYLYTVKDQNTSFHQKKAIFDCFIYGDRSCAENWSQFFIPIFFSTL